VLFILYASPVLADRPIFTIDNSYDRNESYDPNGVVVTETFSQNYSLDWTESITDRLDASLIFKLTMDDTHASEGVDTKNVSPTFDLNLLNPIWDLTLTVQDNIEYSNEFNSARKDAIEYGVELNLLPYILPPLSATYRVAVDDQENLSDSTSKKLDLNTDYLFGKSLNVNGAWKLEVFDDRLNDLSDTESQDWNLNLSWYTILTPALKFNLESSWDGGSEETLDNSGTVISSSQTETLDNSFKLSLVSWPGIISNFELSQENDLVEGSEDGSISFSIETGQVFLGAGTLLETLEISRDSFKSSIPQEDSTESTYNFSVEFFGDPSKYLSYSVNQTFEWKDSDFADSSQDTNTRSDAFDLSLSLFPTYYFIVDITYNQSADFEGGSQTAESKQFKLSLDYSGEVLNVPNLLFVPKLDYSTDIDLVTDVKNVKETIDLDLIYEFNLPPQLGLIVQPSYSWSRSNGDTTTEDLTVDYEVFWDLQYGQWSVLFNHNGDYTKPLLTGTEEEDTFDKEFNVIAIAVLAGNIDFDLDYQFTMPDGDDNQDSLTLSLVWLLYNSTISTSFENSRTFSDERDETRTFTVEFFMEF
jgi:hypothetical protein